MEINLQSLKESKELIIPESEVSIKIMGDGAFTIPTNLSYPQVTEILSPYCALKFTNKTFPNLETISFLKLDSKKRMISELPNLKNLKSLGIGPISDESIFGYIDTLKINELNLSGGKITNLKGISKVKNLTSLRLHNLNYLIDIAEMDELKQLKELTMLYCTNLSKFDVILNLKTLSKLTIANCKAFDNNKYEKVINAMHINNMHIWNP